MNLDSDWSRTNNCIVLFLLPPYTVSMRPCWAVVLPKCRGKWIAIRPWWLSLLQWWLSQTCLLVLRIPLWITWAPAFCNILSGYYFNIVRCSTCFFLCSFLCKKYCITCSCQHHQKLCCNCQSRSNGIMGVDLCDCRRAWKWSGGSRYVISLDCIFS